MKHPDKFQVAVAVDQLINTIFGGFADETLSSRLHRRRLRGKPWCARIVNFLFYMQDDHCKEAYESEIERAHLPLEMRSEK